MSQYDSNQPLTRPANDKKKQLILLVIYFSYDRNKLLIYSILFIMLSNQSFSQNTDKSSENALYPAAANHELEKVYHPDNVLYESPVPLNTWSLSFQAGALNYIGVRPIFNFRSQNSSNNRAKKDLSFGYNIAIQKQLTYLLGVEFQSGYGIIKGYELHNRTSYFRTTFFRTSVNMLTNIKGIFFDNNKIPHWKADLYAGIGTNMFTSTAYNLSGVPGQTLRVKHALFIPTGLLVSYEMTPRIDISLNLNINKVFSDKFNASSSGDSAITYIQVNGSGAGATVYNESPRRNFYSSLSLGVTYKLGKNTRRSSKILKSSTEDGLYHLRYADFRSYISPPKSITLTEADSIAKANMPKSVDPRLYTDSDGDGVSDLFDKEPNTAPGLPVSSNGVHIEFESYVRNALPAKSRVPVNAKVQTTPEYLKKYFIDISDGNIQGLYEIPENKTDKASYQKMVQFLRSYNHSPKSSSNSMFSILTGTYYVIVLSDCDYQRYELSFSPELNVHIIQKKVNINCK